MDTFLENCLHHSYQRNAEEESSAFNSYNQNFATLVDLLIIFVEDLYGKRLGTIYYVRLNGVLGLVYNLPT